MTRFCLQFLILLSILVVSCSHNPYVPEEISPQNFNSEPKKEILNEPVFSEFTLGPGDEIAVTVWRHSDLGAKIKVSPYGTVTLPLAGEITAAGLSIGQLQDEITERLSKYYRNPVVQVTVTSFRNMKAFVLGEVKRPGVVALEGPMSPIEAIAMAGGLTLDARKDNILLIQGDIENPIVNKINLKPSMKGPQTQYADVQAGNIIYVLPSRIANAKRFCKNIVALLSPLITTEWAIILGRQAYDAITIPEEARGFIGIVQ